VREVLISSPWYPVIRSVEMVQCSQVPGAGSKPKWDTLRSRERDWSERDWFSHANPLNIRRVTLAKRITKDRTEMESEGN